MLAGSFTEWPCKSTIGHTQTHTHTHLEQAAEILGAEGSGRQVKAVRAPARLGCKADDALQSPLQAGEAIEVGGVRHPQTLKEAECQLALERAGKCQT